MQISGSVRANLRAALQSARKLKDGPVHPDTVDHWSRIVALAKDEEETSGFSTRQLINDLEREIETRASGETRRALGGYRAG